MKEVYEFDNSPYRESVIPASENYNYFDGKKQGLALISQLKRLCGEPPSGCYFKTKINREWVGAVKQEWISVVLYYDESIDDHISYLGILEDRYPEYWDEEALKELDIVREV